VAYTGCDRSFCCRWRLGRCPEHHRVRVVLQVLLLQTEGAGRATGRDDAARVRDAEINVRTRVRPICGVVGFVYLLRLCIVLT